MIAEGGISQQSWQSELKELEANLALSTAPWKIVIGHHPVFSSGSGHGGSPELITNLKPILQQYGAQVCCQYLGWVSFESQDYVWSVALKKPVHCPAVSDLAAAAAPT